jgi:polyisoprenoid-binding protein YceI
VAAYVLTDSSRIEVHASSTLHPVRGEARDVRGVLEGEVRDGEILLDPQPSGWVEVPVEGLSSGNRLQDLELRRRIDSVRHPVIRFDLDGVGGGPQRFTVAGRLTFHGVTRPVEAGVEVRLDGDRLVVRGEHTFDITDFGLRQPRILMLKVQPEVRVVAELHARRVDSVT